MEMYEVKSEIRECVKLTSTINKKSNKLVIVDVQPEYEEYIHFDFKEFADFVNSYDEVAVLFNTVSSYASDSETSMNKKYREIGIDTDKCSFLQKEYGFFRGVLDTYGEIVTTKMKEFLTKKKYNSFTDLLLSEVVEIKNEIELFKNFDNETVLDFLTTSRFSIPKQLKDELIKFEGADICGGGENECLAEIQILGSELNFNTIKRFVY